MSLDVYLKMPGVTRMVGARIFIREDGATKMISRAEWVARYPDRAPVTLKPTETDVVYHVNITHNLGAMALTAGLYACLWRPNEYGITHARQLIGWLRAGLRRLQEDPERFRQFNPENGWGSYERLVEFITGYLMACEAHPDAEVSVSV